MLIFSSGDSIDRGFWRMFMKQASDSYRRIAFFLGVKTCQNCLLLLLFKLIYAGCQAMIYDCRKFTSRR